MHPEDFGLSLIVAEEQQRGATAPDPEPATTPQNELLFMERRDFEATEPFHVHEGGKSMPVEGPGTLDTLLIITDSDDFEVWIKVDGEVVIDGSYDFISDISSELNRISAYQKDPEFVVSASNYPFQQELDVVITPLADNTGFDIQRAEIDLVRQRIS